ncbi:hypothetical protein BIY23_02785 [Wolbachia pipientis]|uniref:Uncharacterized protein n=1 Tax=Wolbachia pipientis TaxID=955 RepID=A0A1E7QK53_WOLPI|nr:hypothetical protein [Wolbachia pipientis]OEY86609.1 hypothetical protein BIY23_02785 [Wolbachia pipientis]
MYIGARHVGIIGGKFNCKLDKVRRTYQRCFVDRVTRPVEEKEIKEEIEIQNSFFGTLGAEFGLVFHFKQNVENT